MSVVITVRDIPEETRDQLAARAAELGQSMQQFLRRELIDLARKRSQRELLRAIVERNRRSKSHLSRQFIVDTLREQRDR